MKMLEGAAVRLSAMIACVALLVQPVLAQTPLVAPNPARTGLPGASAFTGEEWMDFRQSSMRVTLPVSTVIGQANPTILRAAANRVGALGGIANTQAAGSGALTNATYRTTHYTPQGSAVSDFVLCYANWSMTSAGETAGANAIIVKPYLEFAGISYALFFNGQGMVTIQPGATACTDPAPLTIAANAVFYDRVNVANGGSGTWPLGRSFTIGGGDGNNAGASGGDVASATGAITGSASYQFGPVSITGKLATPVRTVGVIGDSIAAGFGDFPSLGIYQGFIERGLGNLVPWVSATRGGYLAAFVAPPIARALSVFARGQVSTVIDELGVNDAGPSADLPTMEATKLTEWSMLTARGLRVVQTTITPNTTTSTDNWTSVAGQTTSNPAAAANRAGFNDWLRCGAPIVAGAGVACNTAGAVTIGQNAHPLAGYIEVADGIESARNSGKFALAATARSVTDATTTSGSATLTSASAAFSQADKGVTVYVAGAGASGAALATTILTVNSATSVTLLANAGTTVSGAAMAIGGLTADGLHPDPAGHLLLAARVTAAVASGLVQ